MLALLPDFPDKNPPGVETESAAFSRNTSMANDDITESAAIPGSTTPNPTVPTCGSPVSPIRELPELKDVMVQVGPEKGGKVMVIFGDG